MNDNRNRRDFLKTSTAVTASSLLTYHSGVQAAEEVVSESANERPTLALIGAGRMGHNHMRFAKGMCDVVAVCDVDTEHRERAVKNVTEGKGDGCNDYRDVLDRDDIDVVYIATPDHWHAKILIEAMRVGKDVYCEKPLTLTIDEGKQVREVQKETGRVVQVGTMQRSFLDLFVKAVAMAADGRMGKINRVTAAIGGAPSSDAIAAVTPPTGLDWNQWLGPAPEADFRLTPKQPDDNIWTIGATNAHQQFRWWYDYSGGKMTDWGAHHVDIACWALRAAGQSDTVVSIGGESSLPVEYEAGYPSVDDRYNTATSYALTALMDDGVELLITSEGRNGVLIEGDKGRIFVNRGALQGAPVEQLADDPLPEDAVAKAYKGLPAPYSQHKNHWANFFHCIRERCEPISDVTSHLRAIDLCHLANISIRLGRDMQWDAETETIVGDDEANGFLAREYRKGFEIEG